MSAVALEMLKNLPVDEILAIAQKIKQETTITVHQIDFTDKFSFNDVRKKIATKEYKSVTEIVTDLTRLIRFIDNEGGAYIRKDYDAVNDVVKKSYLTINQMQTYANTLGKITLEPYSEKKPGSIWLLICEYQYLFTVVGQKFYSPRKDILSFFYGYKYEKDTITSIDENDPAINEWLNFVKECVANDGYNDDSEENIKLKDQIYNYILNWIAYMMQNPSLKNETAIILKGLQGTGKGTFTNVLCEMLVGYSDANITELNDITGRFNAKLENKKLLILNEAKNAGDDRMANFDSLKSKITDPLVNIEEKNQPRRTVENVGNYIICTNNAFPVKIELSDRRYLVLMMNSIHCGDLDYWEKLNATMYDDAAGKVPKVEFFTKLTQFFLTRDISKYNPRRLPQTTTKDALVEASKKPIETWIEEHYDDLTSEYGMLASDAQSTIPSNIKARSFKNELLTYCKYWQPRINGTRSSAHYYKLLPQLVAQGRFKQESIANNDAINDANNDANNDDIDAELEALAD